MDSSGRDFSDAVGWVEQNLRHESDYSQILRLVARPSPEPAQAVALSVPQQENVYWLWIHPLPSRIQEANSCRGEI